MKNKKTGTKHDIKQKKQLKYMLKISCDSIIIC
jgi:hypothetical protein